MLRRRWLVCIYIASLPCGAARAVAGGRRPRRRCESRRGARQGSGRPLAGALPWRLIGAPPAHGTKPRHSAILAARSEAHPSPGSMPVHALTASSGQNCKDADSSIDSVQARTSSEAGVAAMASPSTGGAGRRADLRIVSPAIPRGIGFRQRAGMPAPVSPIFYTSGSSVTAAPRAVFLSH